MDWNIDEIIELVNAAEEAANDELLAFGFIEFGPLDIPEFEPLDITEFELF